MDWNHQIEQHRAVLQRIVALLFALANLADRASGRSFRVRCEVLFILSHGEAVAREFILEEAQASRMPILYLPAPAHDDGGSAGDALETSRALARAGRHPGIHLGAPFSAIRRQRPRHFRLSDGPAPVACQILRTRSCFGFRALDSPFRRSG